MKFKTLNREYFKDKYLNNIVTDSKLINKNCELCNKRTWDLLIDGKHMCGICYDYIYNDVIQENK